METYQEYLETIKDKKTRKILEYLLSVSQDKNSIMFSCVGLGDAVNIYRQTVSKKILDLETLGFVTINERYHVFNAAFTRSYIKSKLISSDELSNNFAETSDESAKKLISSDEIHHKTHHNNSSKLITTDENHHKLISKFINSDENHHNDSPKLITTDENHHKLITTDELSNIFREVLEEELEENAQNYDLDAFSNDFLAIYNVFMDDYNDNTPESYAEALIKASVHVTADLFYPLRKKQKRNEEETDRKKKKEINKERKKMSEDERSEYSYIGGENKKDPFEKGTNNFEDKNLQDNFKKEEPLSDTENSQEDFKVDINSQVFSNFNFERKGHKGLEEDKRPANKKYDPNPYTDKPYYSQSEFKEITATLASGTVIESPVKLFLYIFWWSLYDDYLNIYHPVRKDEQNNEDDYEEENLSDLKMEGAVFYLEGILSLLKTSYEELEGAVRKGTFEETVDGRTSTCPLGFDSFEEFDPFYILDWNRTDIDGDPALMVCMDRIRNISAPDIEKLRAPRSREEIKQENRNSQQMIELIRASAPEVLTPVEAVIEGFLKEFAVFDDSGHIETFRTSKPMFIPGYGGKKGEHITSVYDTKELGKQVYIRLVAELCEKYGASIGDFLSVRSNIDSAETIYCKGAVFSYTKVTNLNAEKGWKSQVTSSITSKEAE